MEWVLGLQDAVLELSGSPWIYLVLYALCTIDGFFPPVPSESVVIALAVLSVQHDGPALPLVIVVAALGAFTGDIIAYTIGTRIPVRRLRWLRGAKGQAALDWAEQALEHRGASFIIAARYVPVGRVAVNMTAGSIGYPRRRFRLLASIAAVSWALYSVAIGRGAGSVVEDNPLLGIVIGVVGGILLGIVLDAGLSALSRRKLRRQQAATGVVPPVPAAPVAADGVRVDHQGADGGSVDGGSVDAVRADGGSADAVRGEGEGGAVEPPPPSPSEPRSAL